MQNGARLTYVFTRVHVTLSAFTRVHVFQASCTAHVRCELPKVREVRANSHEGRAEVVRHGRLWAFQTFRCVPNRTLE